VTDDATSSRMSSRYTRVAIEWTLVGLFAGLALAILGVAGALVYWAWTA
jgi:hypothetical protein